MNELEIVAATFKTSEPIFTISIGGHKDSLDVEVKDRYEPPKTGEPINDLLTRHWRESLNKRDRRFESYINLDGAYREIVNVVHQVALHSSPLKNPKQSRLFKWLDERQLRYNDSSSAGYIALYKYILEKGIEENRDNTNPHAKNVLAVLELMREKYEN